MSEAFNLELEHEIYNFIVYRDVNNYIAQTESGSVKQKGIFTVKPVLGKSTDTLVIAKALNEYYVNNISFDDFIKNPEKNNLHIYDYCKSNKIGKDFKVYHNGSQQQQLNRYYFQKGGAYLYKAKPGGTMQHVNVGQGVVLFNNYEDKSWDEYNINYAYYTKACRDIIDSINKYNQLTLF